MASRAWIKIHCDRWFDGTIRQEAPVTRAIWVDLLALAGSGRYGDTGEVKLAPGVGLTDDQICKIINVDSKTWLQCKARLIVTTRINADGNNVITILNWARYQSEYERQKKYRNQKLQPEVTGQSDGEKEKEKEKEKENRGRTVSKDTSCPYQDIIDSWIERVPSLPKPLSPINLSSSRAKAMKARWKDNPEIGTFHSTFRSVESSDFLSGRNGKWTSCNIDWVLKPSNWQKIKEGNYDNRAVSRHLSGFPGNRPADAFSDVVPEGD